MYIRIFVLKQHKNDNIPANNCTVLLFISTILKSDRTTIAYWLYQFKKLFSWDWNKKALSYPVSLLWQVFQAQLLFQASDEAPCLDPYPSYKTLALLEFMQKWDLASGKTVHKRKEGRLCWLFYFNKIQSVPMKHGSPVWADLFS